MLTPDQLERISQISNPILRQRFSSFYQIPQDLQNSMFSEQTSGSVWSIIKDKHGLPDNSVSAAARVIGLIFLGELPIKNFIAEIKSKLKVDVAKAQAIAQDINQAIFQPVRQSLMRVHNIQERDTNPPASPKLQRGEPMRANDTNKMTNIKAQMPNQAQRSPLRQGSAGQANDKFIRPQNNSYDAQKRRDEVLNKIRPPQPPTARPAGYYHVLRKNNVVNLKKLKKKNKYDGFFSA